jgi:hypothetical protein
MMNKWTNLVTQFSAIIFAVTTFSFGAYAELSPSDASSTNASGIVVPHSEIYNPAACLDKSKFGKIITKASMPADISDLELITRLVYAESAAANCPENRDDLYVGIAALILNRVHAFEATKDKNDNAVTRAVFGKSQFASSIHSYDKPTGKARWEDFICPKDSDLYKKIYDIVGKVSRGEINVSAYTEATHYYLHMHSGTHMDQPWGKRAVPLKEFGHGCLVLYKVFIDDKHKSVDHTYLDKGME